MEAFVHVDHPVLDLRFEESWFGADAFALASDLMEPFRPWVDQAVISLLPLGAGELDRERKQAMLGIYESPALLGSEEMPLWIAIQRSAANLAGAFIEAGRNGPAQRVAARLSFPLLPMEDEG